MAGLVEKGLGFGLNEELDVVLQTRGQVLSQSDSVRPHVHSAGL